MENAITIYGTWWCGDCTRARRFFDNYQIAYQWIDIDQDEEAAQFVMATNRGMRSVPTIVFEDGSILVEPTESQLKHVFGSVSPTA